jgi:hypothetical protein
LADVLNEELFDPVSGIDDEETEGVFTRFEELDGGLDVRPRLGPGKTGDVQVLGAALGIEIDGVGRVLKTGRLSESGRCVEGDALRRLERAAHEVEGGGFGHGVFSRRKGFYPATWAGSSSRPVR